MNLDHSYFLDTNSFSHYMSNDYSIIDYTDLEKSCKSKQSIVMITPYTLLEYFDSITDIDEVHKIINKLMLKDFWVYNHRNVLDKDCLVEYGLDFLFDYDLVRPELFDSFLRKRELLRERVVDSLFQEFFNYSAILSLLHLWLIYSNEDGELEPQGRSFLDCWEIVVSKNVKTIYASYITYRFDYKKNYQDLLMGIICQILAATNAMYILRNQDYDNDIFNELIYSLYPVYSEVIKIKDYQKLDRKIKKKTNNRVSSRIIMTNKMHFSNTLLKECLIYLVECGYTSKDIFNDFIDIINLNSVSFKNGKAVFITEEKKWLDFVARSHNSWLDNTKNFYNNYYKGKHITFP